MTYWIAIGAFFLCDVILGVLPDASQAAVDFTVLQIQATLCAWLFFMQVSYANTYRKVAALLVLVYVGGITATDWALSWYPPWGALVEALVFGALGGRAMWKIHAVSRRQKAG